MKKNFRREYVISVLNMIVNLFGGHCYIKALDKRGRSITISPILLEKEGDDIVGIFDDYYDSSLSFDIENIRKVIVGRVIVPATVHEYRDGRHYCYSAGNHRLEGVSFNVFDQTPYAKHPEIKNSEECTISIACQFSDKKSYIEFFEKEADIIK